MMAASSSAWSDLSSSSSGVIVPLVAHDDQEPVAATRRRLQEDPTNVNDGAASNAPSEFDVDPLYQGFGTHFVDLWMGCSTPQRRTMVVDTASSFVGFPCGLCPPSHSQCNALGDKTKSECFEWVGCSEDSVMGQCSSSEMSLDKSSRIRSMSVSYTDGTGWDGFIAQDHAYTGGLHEHPSQKESAFSPLYFGCQNRVQRGPNKKWLTQGILGMDRTKSSYQSQWATARAAQQNMTSTKKFQQFSLCFQRPRVHEAGAGTMVLGGLDPRLNKHDMVYANMLRHSSYYVVWLERIYLRINGGKSVAANSADSRTREVYFKPAELNQNPFVVDSALEGLWLSSTLESDFKMAWQKLTGKAYNLEKKHSYTDEEIDNFPTILLQLSPKDKSKNVDKAQIGLAGHDGLDKVNAKSILVALAPKQYMRFIDKKQRYGYSRIRFHSGNGQQRLGYPIFIGHQVHFDIANERIGFAESDCDSWALGNRNFNHTDSTAPMAAEDEYDNSAIKATGADDEAPDDEGRSPAAGYLLLFFVVSALAVFWFRCRRHRGLHIPQQETTPGFSDGSGFRDQVEDYYSDDGDDGEEDENEFLASDDEGLEMTVDMTRRRRRQ